MIQEIVQGDIFSSMSVQKQSIILQMNDYADALHDFIQISPPKKKECLVKEWKQVMEWLTSQFKYGQFN